MLKKLRIKFICIIMAIVTAMVCVIMGLLIRFLYEHVRMEINSAIQSASMDPGFHRDNPEDAPHLPYFTIEKDNSGELSARSRIYYRYFTDEDLLRVWNTVEAKDRGILEEYGLSYQCFSSPRGERYVFVDHASQKAMFFETVHHALLIGFSALLLFFAISVWLAHWAVKPVEKMWDQQRQFIADASHELKTPLTVIMTNTELLKTVPCDEQSRETIVSNISTVTHEMRTLVESLLELARVDGDVILENRKELNFSNVINDCVMLFEPLMFENALTVHCAVQENIKVMGSEQHLRHMAEILLENALKYSLKNGTVNILLKIQGGDCVLSVSNPAEPVSKQELKRIFQRFYRLDKTRSRNGSYGLGLAIAHQTVEKHGGRIWADYSEGRFSMYVQLPLCDS